MKQFNLHTTHNSQITNHIHAPNSSARSLERRRTCWRTTSWNWGWFERRWRRKSSTYKSHWWLHERLHYMMDKNKEFDEKLLDESFTSLKEAYRTLALESTKKYKANIIRQFCKSRCAFQTHVVCVTDKNAVSLSECVLVFGGDQKEEEERRQQHVLHRKRG